jgi:hypothetical protein
VDPETIRKRTDKAIFVFRKALVVAGRQGWLTVEQSKLLDAHIFEFQQIFMLALPCREMKDEEGWLPF